MCKKYVLSLSLSLLLMVSFSSCSRLDLAVNLADSYLVHKADEYFDLTREQSKWLKDAIRKDIAQVKKVIFPQLSREMLKIADTISVQRSFTPALVLSTYERFENLVFEGARLFSSTARDFSDRLIPTQLVSFQKEFEEKMVEMKKKNESNLYKKMKKQFESWMGSISSTQKNSIKSFSETSPVPVDTVIQERRLLASKFAAAFSDKAARRNYVEKLFNHYQEMLSGSYVKAVNEHQQKVASFVAKILDGISEDQRKTLIETIRDRANQLTAISKG